MPNDYYRDEGRLMSRLEGVRRPEYDDRYERRDDRGRNDSGRYGERNDQRYRGVDYRYRSDDDRRYRGREYEDEGRYRGGMAGEESRREGDMYRDYDREGINRRYGRGYEGGFRESLRGTSDYGEPNAGRRSRQGDYDDYYDTQRNWNDVPGGYRYTSSAWREPDIDAEWQRRRGGPY